MSIDDPTMGMQEFDMAELHDLSIEILSDLEDSGVDVPTAAVALAMSLGRLLSPRTLEAEEEVELIKALMEFGQLYFVKGVAN